MRVKRLEIQGFKSFKDKTVIHFDHGITGIVGPNGCGKSNIVDAFFWVMGEQSYKHMRGSCSEDLIFNGSSKYSPLGVAEATLVMETDYEGDSTDAPAGATAKDIPIHLRAKEVSVTRRLYRTGEGEYFINGVQARLKDIHELFMDTGVGAKGYSVIEQGQIGKIVNSKPEDRRLLVEEAAGIAKYKARKKESLRKMEATQSNLSRLNDVVQEIERSLGSLERQAQKARQYKKFKEELLDKEMTWGRRKHQVLNQKLESLKLQKTALEQDLVGLRAELSTAENSVEVERIEQLTLTKLAEDFQAQIQNLSDELTHEKSALDLSKRRQSDLQAQLQALESEKGDLDLSLVAEREKLAARETEGLEIDEFFRGASQKAQAMDEEARRVRQETETARRALDQTKRELMAGIAQASDLTSRAASLASRAESARTQAERLAQQAQAQADKVVTLREEYSNAQTQSEGIRAKRDVLATEKQSHQSGLQDQERSVRDLERTRDVSQRELTQVKSRLQSLEELAAAFEGFGEGPKAALEWARNRGDSEKLIALTDAFVIANGFDAALEGWLESRLECLVSADNETALGAIAELSQGNQGRVAIQVSPPSLHAATTFAVVYADAEQRLRDAGFDVQGELAQFVQVNSRCGEGVARIAASLVSQVVVVKDFGPMHEFLSSGAASGLPGWSIVSLDGAALDAFGTLRGGNASGDEDTRTANLLKRKRAIAELSEQMSALEATFNENERRVVAARETLEGARARIQEISAQLQAAEIESASIERDIHQMSRALRDSESQAELLQVEAQEMAEEATRAAAERAGIQSEIEQIVSTRSDFESRIAAGEGEVAEKDAQARALETELSSLRIEEAQLRERTQSLGRELDASRALISDRTRRLTEIDRMLERVSRDRETFMGGETGMEAKIADLSQSLSGQRAELAAVKDRLEQIAARLGDSHEQIKELHQVLEQKNGSSTSLAIEGEKLSAELSHLISNLEEKYGAGCFERPVTSPIQDEMNEPIVTAEMSAEEEQLLGEEVERLKDRMRRLGEVNLMAIEEYEELKKRYDHLISEKLDLETSIQNLQDAIEHINKTSEERFRKAFEAIADRFERLFPIIFGGGQAKLSLVYPEGSTDILDAGVDILAQPPGKKIVNIGLLSGGEKALTAVSLIFAIFMVKPSPFCVLDEVDAPLDDANIGKFNALLREMSSKSQFILITHNKKTMELNDTLYGVTMEEPGVSKMVSIEMH